MTDNFDDLDRRLARLFEASRREGPEEHPAPEKLSAYQANELPPEEADDIQEHLIQCTFCTDLLLNLERFLEPSEEDSAPKGVVDLGTELGWRKVQTEVGWKELPGEVSRLRKHLRVLQAIAAALLIGTMGLAAYAFRLHEDLKAPQVTFLALSPSSSNGVR